MPEQKKPAKLGPISKWWHFNWRTQTIVAVVCVAAGILFGISAQSTRGAPSQLGLNLPRLVAEKQAALKATETSNQQMQAQINKLLATANQGDTANGGIDSLLNHTVVGPGVSVKLADSPADVQVGPKVDANDLVVHQQDIDAVMNALWGGGAEAMTVQGIRVTPSLPIRCIGNVILVGGHTFAPPYVISAIGNPETLSLALEQDPQIVIYKQYVAAYSLVWEKETKNELNMPPLSETTTIQFALPADGDTNG